MEDDFTGEALDRSVWLPHYLPAWSSKAATRASYAVHDSCLELSIPPDQGLWCADEHHPPLRVSGVQSGNFSGAVGTTTGQQPFRPGLLVREEQEPFWGWTPRYGRIEVVAGMTLAARSMASLWMVGLEVDPRECAEICVFEIFGDAVVTGRSAAVGCGLHAFRDPTAREDFATVTADIDVSEPHAYAVDWTEHAVTFSVDGVETRRCEGPPAYPMQAMLAVFDFPDRATDADRDHVPRLVVDRISGPA